MRAIVIVFLLTASSPARSFELHLPLKCSLGISCVIQHYVDHDPGPGAKDYRCGGMTYDGHNGTDFRVPSLQVMRTGVPVLAAASGRVLRVRDGIADHLQTSGKDRAIQGIECGNGIVIAHGESFETQYCHMQQGSITVRPGMDVHVGEPIGRIGLSGLTQFPHVHLTVRKQGQLVDPFAADAAPNSCGLGGTSLWAKDLAGLQYHAGQILNAGFAANPVTMQTIEEGTLAQNAVDLNSPALIAYVRAIGLKNGDVQRLILTAPDGSVWADSGDSTLDANKAQIFLYTGRRRPVTGYAPGNYRALYNVNRNGATALTKRFDLDLKS